MEDIDRLLKEESETMRKVQAIRHGIHRNLDDAQQYVSGAHHELTRQRRRRQLLPPFDAEILSETIEDFNTSLDEWKPFVKDVERVNKYRTALHMSPTEVKDIRRAIRNFHLKFERMIEEASLLGHRAKSSPTSSRRGQEPEMNDIYMPSIRSLS